MDKGINLQIEDLKSNLAKIINESCMPVSIVEMVLTGLLQEAHMVKVQQVEKEKQEYEKAKQEENNSANVAKK